MMSFCLCCLMSFYDCLVLYHDLCLCSYASSRSCWNFCVYHFDLYLSTTIYALYRDPCPYFCASIHCYWNAYPLSCWNFCVCHSTSSYDPCCWRIYAHGPCPDPCFCVKTYFPTTNYDASHRCCSNAFRHHALCH